MQTEEQTTRRVRAAGPGDEAIIVRLIRHLAWTGDWESPIEESHARSYLAYPGCGVLLAEEGSRAVGLLSYCIRPDLFHAANCCMIDELVVEEEARRHGVGSALLAEVLRRARQAGCVEVGVSTMPDNEGAQRLYRRHGLTDEALLLEVHLEEGAG